MTFRALAKEVLEQRERDGVRGLDRELSRFRCHIDTAAFATKDVAELTHRDIRAWLRAMAQKDAEGPGEKRKLSRQTIDRCKSLVSAIFVEAVERELREDNPCDNVRSKKRVDESDTRVKWAYLTPEEQSQIARCEAIPKADRIMIRFTIGTGLRQGEWRHLELPDLVVHGDDPHVHVRIAGRRNGKPLPPKSGKTRKVPLFGDALAAALEWVALLPTYAPANPENLAFPTTSGRLRQQGKPFGRSGTLRGYYQAAGIKLRPHLHFHALRHTFASNLISGALTRRWSMQEVQVLMGHSSIMVTQRYAHLGEDAIAVAVRETVAGLHAVAEPVLMGANDGADRKRVFARGAEQVRKHLENTGALKRIASRLESAARGAASFARRVAGKVTRTRHAA
ncbi:MAG: site-specific integrase [Labilithrix sp.]|nr:site-specific integrase [Labilithrix sp.]